MFIVNAISKTSGNVDVVIINIAIIISIILLSLFLSSLSSLLLRGRLVSLHLNTSSGCPRNSRFERKRNG